MPAVDVDQLHSISRDRAATVANEALHPIQDHRNHEQIVGVATLFAALCHRLMLDPQRMWEIGSRVLRPEPFHDKGNVQIEVLRDFAGIKLEDKAP